ncbi:hypothetical protein EJ104_08690 [Deinococcus radiophilus]|uniref:Uncharacterized protein n=1 Tax=Deinococcus radiophilus TaxID=32062 RepID=A0A3S0REA0_9DEIO|nr:hypothetical protein EJ104_08690 [Deinococcus radiophilus]
MFLKGGGYTVPLRAEVRRALDLKQGGDMVTLSLRSGKAARTVQRMSDPMATG